MQTATDPRSQAQSNKSNVTAWIIFATGILYYCYAYLLRISPSVMEEDLLIHFHITASAFGGLVAFYYYAYAPMQLPIGLVIDRFGTRKALIFACTTALVGLYIFANSSSFAFAAFGRFLMGFGSAFAYITALKLATIWLPRNKFATATGIATGAGMLSGVFADLTLTQFVEGGGYKAALYFCIIIGIVLLMLIISVVKDKKSLRTTDENKLLTPHLKHSLILLAKNPQMWLIGIIGALMYLPASVFLDVWGIPYLKDVYHFSANKAAFGASSLFMGWIIANPIAGFLSDKLHTRKWPLTLSAFCAAGIITFIFYGPHLPENILFILLFILGMFCATHPLCFTLAKENNAAIVAGSSIAFTNFLIMIGGVIFQPLVGTLLDRAWSGDMMLSGIRVYSAHDYTFALSMIPLGLLLAGVLGLLLKETYHNDK